MTAEEAAAGGEGRRVHRLQDQVFERVDQGLLGDGVVAPKDEDEVLALLRQGADGGVGELFPAVARVRGGLSGAHCQRGIEEQHPFPSPFLEIARARHGHAEVVVQLLEDILQAGRERHTVGHREREAVGLSRAVVRVLTQDDHLHLVERREVEGVEDQGTRGIYGILPLLADEKRLEVGEIRCLELRPQHLVPTRINIRFLNFHFFNFYAKMIIFPRKMRYFANQILNK